MNSLFSGQTSWEAASQRAGIQQLVQQSLSQQTNIYLPVIQPKKNRQVGSFSIRPESALQDDRWTVSFISELHKQPPSEAKREP